MNPISWYFPDGPPVSDFIRFSPVTDPNAGHGPENVQLFMLPPQAPMQSLEQGVGRSPGQQWPHMPHVTQFNFDSLSNMGEHPYALNGERYGWSAPVFYQQQPGQHYGVSGPIAIPVAPTVSYTEVANYGGY